MLRLQKHDNGLLLSNISYYNQIAYTINVYKIFNHLLLEVYKANDSVSYYKFIADPLQYITRFYKYSNINLIIKAIKLDVVPYILTITGKTQFFCDAEKNSEEKSTNPKFYLRLKDKNLIIGYQLSNKSAVIKLYDFNSENILVKHFSIASILEIVGKYDLESFLSAIRCNGQSITTSSIHTLHSPSMVDVNDKIIYRTCTRFIGVLYQVTASINGDDLKFTYKRGSFMGLGIEFMIGIDSACERFGFSRSFLIPMVNYMIKNILVLKDDEIVLDNSQNSINIDYIICKIQAAFRSYSLRKKLKDFLYMKFLVKVKKAMENSVYSILLYEKTDCFLLCAINRFEVLRKLIPKQADMTPEWILKSHMNDLFIIHDVGMKGKSIINMSKRKNKEKTFLTESSISKTLLWECKGLISGLQSHILLYDIGKYELLECYMDDKTLLFEVDSNYLKRNNQLLNKLEITKESELFIKANIKKLIFFQIKIISNYQCKVQVLLKKGISIAIIYIIKAKRYIIKRLSQQENLSELLDSGKIQEDGGNYILYI